MEMLFPALILILIVGALVGALIVRHLERRKIRRWEITRYGREPTPTDRALDAICDSEVRRRVERVLMGGPNNSFGEPYGMRPYNEKEYPKYLKRVIEGEQSKYHEDLKHGRYHPRPY